MNNDLGEPIVSTQLHMLVELANLFEKKEIMVTVTEMEKNSLIRYVLENGHGVDYTTTAPVLKLDIQSFFYKGVTIHLNVIYEITRTTNRR